MAILSPSLLAADPLNLGKEIQRAEAAGAQWLHVDVMDGCFVPNLSSFTYSTVAAMRKATSLTLDVHLMIEKPIRYVEDFCRAGADYLTIHVEADSRENIRAALEKNPAVRICLTAVSLESLTQGLRVFEGLGLQNVDVTQLTAAQAKKLGSYHMMLGQNPVYILSGEGQP